MTRASSPSSPRSGRHRRRARPAASRCRSSPAAAHRGWRADAPPARGHPRGSCRPPARASSCWRGATRSCRPFRCWSSAGSRPGSSTPRTRSRSAPSTATHRRWDTSRARWDARRAHHRSPAGPRCSRSQSCRPGWAESRPGRRRARRCRRRPAARTRQGRSDGKVVASADRALRDGARARIIPKPCRRGEDADRGPLPFAVQTARIECGTEGHSLPQPGCHPAWRANCSTKASTAAFAASTSQVKLLTKIENTSGAAPSFLSTYPDNPTT